MTLRASRLVAVTCVVLGAASCSGSAAPSIEEMQAICALASDPATRSVETVRECIKVGGAAACKADQETGRDEICDAALEGLGPDDVNPPDVVRDELEQQRKAIEACYGDGTQSVDEFEACAAALDD